MRIDPSDFYKGMNASVMRRNAALEEQGGLRWDNEQRQMSQGLEQGDLMSEMLRARIDRMRQPMPDFYGGGGPSYTAPQFGQWDNVLREAFANRGKRGSEMNALAKLMEGIK